MAPVVVVVVVAVGVVAVVVGVIIVVFDDCGGDGVVPGETVPEDVVLDVFEPPATL